jgi:hypothetical protein
MVVTRISIATAWTALWLVVSCDTGPSREDLAQERFEEFQTALLQRDQAALKYLVCSDARPAIPEMCQQDRSKQLALQVTGVSKRQYEYLVHVTDPNQSDQASHFVLTIEDGAMRVDLRATYWDHSVENRRFLAEERFVPQRLSPDQIKRARAVHSSPSAQTARPGR